MLFQIADRLQDNAFINGLTSTGWTAALVAIIHYYSMFVLVGSMVIVDLNVLGVVGGSKSGLSIARRVLPWAWISLPVNLLSGFIMFAADATGYVTAWSFGAKVLIVLLAIAISVAVQLKVMTALKSGAAPSSIRTLAVVSILFWVGAILMGVEVPVLSHIG
jgi:hypothetical protein